jgi:hypothetical protein
MSTILPTPVKKGTAKRLRGAKKLCRGPTPGPAAGILLREAYRPALDKLTSILFRGVPNECVGGSVEAVASLLKRCTHKSLVGPLYSQRKYLKLKAMDLLQIQSRIKKKAVQRDLKKSVMLFDSVPGHQLFATLFCSTNPAGRQYCSSLRKPARLASAGLSQPAERFERAIFATISSPYPPARTEPRQLFPDMLPQSIQRAVELERPV